jgi:hypothetical protein
MTDWLASLTTPALIGLLVTAVLLVLTNDWRLSFAALGAQYVLAAVLMAQTVIWQVVAAKAVVGALVVVVLTITGRAASFGRAANGSRAANSDPTRGAPQSPSSDFPTNLPFRGVSTMLAAVAVWYLVTEGDYAFPGLPVGVSLAGYLLIGLGLLNLGLTEEPMNAGMGLLTLMTGFDLIYASIEPSRAVVALMAAMHFGVALAVSYLALLRHAGRGAGV